MQKIEWDKLGFKYMDTRCHVRYEWRQGKWNAGELVNDPHISLHIAASCMHYGQASFEGLKAFRCKDGAIRMFRPQANAARMAAAARRICMAAPSEALFLDACSRAVRANADYVPPYGTGGSLYIRPLLIGSGMQIGVAPADAYTFIVMVIPVGPYYTGALKPVRAIVFDDHDRAAPLGVGDVKVAGNYAASLFAHEEAKRLGYPVELYLDAREHAYVEEFATSNFIAITKDGRYVTPDSHSILPSVINNTLQQLARTMGLPVEKRLIRFEEISDFAEVGACGTAVVVTPVWQIVRGDQTITIGTETACGPVLQKLYNHVQGIQYGDLPDAHGWCLRVDE